MFNADRYAYGPATAPTALDEIQVYHDAGLTAADLQKIYDGAMVNRGSPPPSSTGALLFIFAEAQF